MFRILVAVVAVLGTCGAEPAFAKRMALVIANARYAHVPALKNPPADGRLIAGALRRAGFDTVEQRPDLGKAAMEAALRDFGRRAEGAEVALIYFAGHGIEAGGENYLIPVDAKLERDRDLDVEATRLDTALRMGDGARMRIVILDACRNNPFIATMQRATRSRAVGRGLAAIEPEGETLVVYAAKAGATAADGEGANSPFANALATRLVQPGLEIGLLFRAVRDDVLRSTGRTQEPFTYGSLSGNAFYFIPGSRPAAPPVVQTVSPQSEETLFWQGALSANTQAAFSGYLERYPKGRYAGLARENLGRLRQPPVVAAPADPASTIRQARYDNGMFPNMARAFTASGAPASPPGDANALLQRFSFVPDLALRARLREKTLSQFGKPGSDFRKQFEPIFPAANPFHQMATFVGRYGLSTDSAVDGAFAYFEAYRQMGSPNWQPPTAQQAQAARRQIAGAMARDPFFQRMRGADLQTASDELWLNSSLLAHSQAGLAKLGRKVEIESRENMSGMTENLFGFSLDTVRLTDQGYVK